MSFFSRMTRLFGRWVVLAAANACPPEAAAVQAVEEFHHLIDFQFILAVSHM
jgi:hypothetical protein